MGDNTGSRYKTYISGLAADFRTNTMVRYETVDGLLARFVAGGSDAMESFELIRSEVHSIKGTAGTFGFFGLSVIAHALDHWMHEVADGKEEGVSLDNPDLATDLSTFLAIMRTFTATDPVQSDAEGRDVLGQTSFTLFREQQQDLLPEDPPLAIICSAHGQDEPLEVTLESLGYDCIFVGLNTGAIAVLETCEPSLVIVQCKLDTEQEDAVSFAERVVGDDRSVIVLAANGQSEEVLSSALEGKNVTALAVDNPTLIQSIAALTS